MNITEIQQILAENVDEDVLEIMVDMTRRFAVLDAIVANDTLDPDVLAPWIYEDKGRHAPVEYCYQVIDDYLPQLVEEGLIVDQKPTAEARMLSMMHQAYLNSDQSIQ